jgi:hypothetical protein
METTSAPQWPGVPDVFATKFSTVCTAAIAGWDRLRLRGSLRPLFSPNWMTGYLRAARVKLTDFKSFAQVLTDQVIDAAKAAAAKARRPYWFIRSSLTDKLDWARELAQRDRITEGLIAVFSTLQPCQAITVRLNRDTGLLTPVVEDRKCLHLYHYLMHPTFGLCHVCVQTWFPFTVEVWLNGRLWLARQMDHSGLAYVRRDNCFTHLSDPVAAQALLEEQHRAPWPCLLRALLRQTHPLHRAITRPLNLSYYWTVCESEFATDLLFKQSSALAPIYSHFVAHGLRTFSSPDVMRFLGHVVPATTGQVNGRFHEELTTSYRRRPEGVRLKHRVGANSIKVYDKAGSVLRVETTLNAPEVFKVWRGKARQGQRGRAWRRLRRRVADLPARAQISQAANRRYLEALASTQATQPLAQLTARLTRPVRWKRRRHRGLNPLNDRDAALLQFISRGEYTLEGFRNRDLQRALFPRKARTHRERSRRSGWVGRRLRLLRAHRLIRKVPGRHRYLVSTNGRQLLTALLAARTADVQQLTALAA